jgi:hypothetical protein
MSSEIELSTAQSPRRVSVFLMNRDLSPGGIEWQFSLMAKASCNGLFDLHLGCMRRRGAFHGGDEYIAKFDVTGSFLTRKAHYACRALMQHLRERNVAVAHAFDFYANLMSISVAQGALVPVVTARSALILIRPRSSIIHLFQRACQFRYWKRLFPERQLSPRLPKEFATLSGTSELAGCASNEIGLAWQQIWSAYCNR